MKKRSLFFLLLFALTTVHAKSKQEINILADATTDRFLEEVVGGKAFLESAAAVLIFPRVLKAGFGIGGEYGEGVLRQGGQNLEYYSTAAASIGFQAGAQSKSVVVVFMTKEALTDFRSKKGWKAGNTRRFKVYKNKALKPVTVLIKINYKPTAVAFGWA